MFGKVKTFFEESRRELKRVNWPTKQETIRYTLFVIGFSIAVAIFLGILDFIFMQLLERLVI
ncbi:MAG: preprotein translocase subunit SecE [Candidatus Jorgensenbacteria bacterium]